MSATKDELQNFRSRVQQGRPSARDEPLVFRPGVALSFDQALAKTGVALVDTRSGKPRIVQTWMLKTETDAKGHEGTVSKALQLDRMVEDLYDQQRSRVEVVVEMPPAGGGMFRSESSLIAHVIIRRIFPYATVVSAQAARSRILGNPKADKPDVKRWVIETLAPDKSVGPLNHDTYDAAFNGCYALLESPNA